MPLEHEYVSLQARCAWVGEDRPLTALDVHLQQADVVVLIEEVHCAHFDRVPVSTVGRGTLDIGWTARDVLALCVICNEVRLCEQVRYKCHLARSVRHCRVGH